MKIVHGSPGFGSMLTEEQTVEFLTDKKLNLLLGTVGKNGDPRGLDSRVRTDDAILEQNIAAVEHGDELRKHLDELEHKLSLLETEKLSRTD